MTGPGRTGPPRDEGRLVGLLARITAARAALQHARALPSTPASRRELARCSERLAAAMEAYADAASRAGVPLPYRYRDELRLHRSLADDLDERGGVRRHDRPAGR